MWNCVRSVEWQQRRRRHARRTPAARTPVAQCAASCAADFQWPATATVSVTNVVHVIFVDGGVNHITKPKCSHFLARSCSIARGQHLVLGPIVFKRTRNHQYYVSTEKEPSGCPVWQAPRRGPRWFIDIVRISSWQPLVHREYESLLRRRLASDDTAHAPHQDT